MMNNYESRHGLNNDHLNILRTILAPYKEGILSVGLFGSRATGQFQPYSDIDLVIFGPLSTAKIDKIRTYLLESALPFEVDLVHYEELNSEELKKHIDSVYLEIFNTNSLSS